MRIRATAPLDLLGGGDPHRHAREPWLTGGAGRGPDVPHAVRPTPAQRLSDGVAPVDDHSGSSSKPAGPSRTSQPSAAISSRSLSAAAKSRSARARSRCSASSTTSPGACFARCEQRLQPQHLEHLAQVRVARRLRTAGCLAEPLVEHGQRLRGVEVGASASKKRSRSPVSSAGESPGDSRRPASRIRLTLAWACSSAALRTRAADGSDPRSGT